jgi:hypothetical protein
MAVWYNKKTHSLLKLWVSAERGIQLVLSYGTSVLIGTRQPDKVEKVLEVVYV